MKLTAPRLYKYDVCAWVLNNSNNVFSWATSYNVYIRYTLIHGIMQRHYFHSTKKCFLISVGFHFEEFLVASYTPE